MDIYPLIKDVPHNVWNAIPEMIAWLTYEYVLDYSYALKFKEVMSYSCASSGAECSLKICWIVMLSSCPKIFLNLTSASFAVKVFLPRLKKDFRL